MKKFLCLILLFGITINLSSQKIHLDSIEPFINQLMEDFEVTGLSIGIVRNDSIIYSKGFGTRKINENLPVDENTIFGIGSISKSFTALTLGILVDEGKINWDDRVKDYLPYFELYNPYVSEKFTIRDLLTHRSGLREISGGILWYHSTLSRKEIIKRLKYLKPVSDFREKPAYQNVMYLVAGEIVSTVTGMSWDKFLKERILDPLGMKNSTSISSVRESTKNLAYPHVWNEQYKKVFVEQEKGDNLAPAGFIYSSANEMISYMRLLLNDGAFGKDTIVSKKTIQEIFKPQILYPIEGSPFSNEFTSYGFGWWITPKGNHKLIEHSGGIDGMAAKLFMIKDLNIGVVILTNISKEPASFLLMAKLLEQILEDKSLDFYTTVKGYRDRRVKGTPKTKMRIIDTNPSVELKKLAGTYSDIMYGDIKLYLRNKNELEISFSNSPIFKGRLKHWHFDTFQIDWYDIRIPDGYLTFNFNSNGEVLGISFDQESLLDVDFSEINFLKKE
ncbi:serine hydrolase [Flagellimonas sp.]|uniref:serine hydrolase n=1 Tax=Flagellimonas sp. TaxID=2058762 RepID=UPI003AB319A9